MGHCTAIRMPSRWYERLLQESPTDLLLLTETAQTLKLLHHEEQAMSMYRRALEQESCHLDALNGLGNLYRNHQEYGKAIHTFRQAVKCAPLWRMPRLSRRIDHPFRLGGGGLCLLETIVGAGQHAEWAGKGDVQTHAGADVGGPRLSSLSPPRSRRSTTRTSSLSKTAAPSIVREA